MRLGQNFKVMREGYNSYNDKILHRKHRENVFMPDIGCGDRHFKGKIVKCL